jgi:hypothetical protein
MECKEAPDCRLGKSPRLAQYVGNPTCIVSLSRVPIHRRRLMVEDMYALVIW